jgi:hypothetical protein
MISSSKRLSFPALAALALVAAGCSYSGEGQIPCVQDASCPTDYPVCGPAGKCIAGTPTAASVAITGVDGHAAADYLSGTVRVLVSARATSGVGSVRLASGSVNFPASTLAAAAPLYAFDVDTTALTDGDATLTATLIAGDNSAATATGTLHVDNAKPVITTFTASGSSSTTITAGTTALLSVSFTPATASATITSGSGGGSITLSSSGSTLVSPDVTTTFTLRVTSRSGVTVQSGTTGQPPDVTVSVVSPASMTGSFTVSPSVITSDDSGPITFTLPSLSASVTAAFIRDDLGTVVVADALTGGLGIAKPALTRTYTLVARNAAGATANATTSVTVRSLANSLNTTLLASAASVTVGGSIMLTPTFPVAYTGFISGTGLSSPLVVTSGQLYPVTITAAGTNAYTLTVQNDATPVATFATAATNVSGVAVPAIATFTASAPTVTNGNTVTFTYNVTGGDCAVAVRCQITGPSFNLDLPAGTNDGSNHVTLTAGTPPSSSTSTYVLTLVNSTGTGAGTVSRSISVQAVAAVGAFTFSVTPTTVNLSATGNLTFALPATIANAASAVIGGGGQSSGNVLGQSTATLPVPDATTTYTLTVKNAAGDGLGTSTRTATVLVGESLGQGSITAARYGAAAVRLPDGRVLVTGGSKDGTLGANALATATVFDPQTGSFSDGASGTTFAMQTGRVFHTATLISSTAPYLVHVAGGATALNTAEIITVNDRAGAAASSAASQVMFGVNSSSGHRCFHNAVLVPPTGDPSAKVLLVGGTDCAGTAAGVTDSVELWTQGTGHALQTNGLASSHVSGTATLLTSGSLLVAGGGNNKAQVRAAPIDTNSPWGSEKTMGSVRTAHSATLLANGKVLLAGGATAVANTVTPSADIYDPGTGNFTAAGGAGLATARADHAAVLLSSGLVLVLGGDDQALTPTSFATSEFYDQGTDKFFLGPSLLTARKQFVAVPLTASTSLSGTLFIAGGTGATAAVTTPAEAMIVP